MMPNFVSIPPLDQYDIPDEVRSPFNIHQAYRF